MEEKFSGIVINGIPFNENDKILNIYTLEKGMISAKIKGVKKAGAKMKFASEPFCFAQFVTTCKSNFYTIIGASLYDSFYDLRNDILTFYCASTIIEFLKKFCKEEIVSSNLFNYSLQALKDLSYSEKQPYFVLTLFLIKALSQIGYSLNLNGCYNCGKQPQEKIFFDYNSGGFLCKNCHQNIGREINLCTYQTLCSVNSNEYLEDKTMLLKALKLLNFYIQNKLEENIKSLQELLNLKV